MAFSSSICYLARDWIVVVFYSRFFCEQICTVVAQNVWFLKSYTIYIDNYKFIYLSVMSF